LITPSQASSAVAGVQLASRQHSSLVPFFQTVPVADFQLSIDFAAPPCDAANAPIGAASAADANSTATLFNFFIDSPLEESRSGLRIVQHDKRDSRAVCLWRSLASDGIGHRQFIVP
jgi:hypothetical protein